MKNYKIGFGVWGVLLFLVIMLPNLVWFAVPAPHDILRAGSQTELIDTIALVCQILFVAALCVVVNQSVGPLRVTSFLVGVIGCIAFYYLGWMLYYFGITNPFVILLLTVPPCGAFLLFALDRKNYIALIPAAIFSVCHLFYGVINYIVK